MTPSYAKQIIIPGGTQVYLELSELVTSKRGENNVGEIIRASVWRNVVVDGHIVIKAGAQAVGRITEIKRRNIAGKKGQLKIAAISARAINGDNILLDGGYHEKGKSRVALSVVLFLFVWPFIFIPGKNAELGPGNVFDSEVQDDIAIDVTGSRPVLKLDMSDEGEFYADVMYDTIDLEKKLKFLPIEIKQCGKQITNPRVVTVNGELLKNPIDMEIESIVEEDDCSIAITKLKFKTLIKQFQLGINRFEVESGGQTTEIVFQAEM